MARRGKPSTVSEADRRGIQSVEVSAVILKSLAAADMALSLKQISDAAKMPSSKVHRYLSSFVRTGLVAQNQDTGVYDLGPTARELGLAALSRMDKMALANSSIKEVSNTTGITGILCVWSQKGPIIVRWMRARAQLFTTMTVGSILPVISSASGRVFVANLPRAITDDLVDRELAQKRRQPAPGDVKTRSELNDILDQVREEGLATVAGSVVPGLRAVAVPMLDTEHEAFASMALLGTDDFLTDKSHFAAQTLKQASLDVACGVSFATRSERAAAAANK